MSYPNFKYLIPGLTLILSSFQGCISYNDKNLEWNQEESYRWARVSPESRAWGDIGFNVVNSSHTNINFVNQASEESIAENRNFLNGSGIAVADVDGDGWVDVYFAGLDVPNKLYKNEGGFRFRDITEEAGVAHDGYNSTGVVFADVDGDGDPDLLIASFDGKNTLYLNDGNGNFSLNEKSGLGFGPGSTTMALADIDGDGDLDLYVTNYKVKSVRDMYSARELSMNRTVRVKGDRYELIPPFDQHYGIIHTKNGQTYRNEYGEPDELYINDGRGRFALADPKEYFFDTGGNPIGIDRDWGLAAKFQDINNDGHPDLFVVNDFWTPDRVWINQGDGTFRAIERNAIRNYSFSSMGVDFSDINRDGAVDIFVTEMLSSKHQRRLRQISDHLEEIDDRPQYNRNSLYLNRGDHTFTEISWYSGLEASEWSWAAKFLDIDLDGYEDLLITTGNGHDYQDLDTNIRMANQDARMIPATSEILEYPSLELPNMIFRNNGDRTFSDMSTDWGFSESDLSHGLATADLDNDGDLETIVNRLNNSARIFENQTVASRIGVRLKGRKPNTNAIGARIKLTGGPSVQSKQISSGGDYLSGSDPMIVFAADQDNEKHKLIVNWPGGHITHIESVKPNRIYEIEEPSNSVADEFEVETKEKPDFIFKDVSERIGHFHHENKYDDFKVNPLLPYKLSQKGPGITWIDFNEDGNDDLFISSGKGGNTAIYENKGNGYFQPYELKQLSKQARGDQTSILGWSQEGAITILTGSANYEQGNPRVASAYRYNIRDKSVTRKEDIPGILSTTGPMAAADYDGDGDIDLFIGGSFVPGRYPKDADSRLFVNEDETFTLDQNNIRTFQGIGLVTGSIFTDYDGDGDPDLLISSEWGTLRLFDNQAGIFREVTQNVGLDNRSGWWNGVATGDFNNDGRPDIIATNIGLNTPYQLRSGKPLKLFFDDFNHDGRLDIVDSYYDSQIRAYVPRKHLMEYESIPTIMQNVSTHREYASSSLETIFRQDFGSVPSKEINTLQHTVFLNKEDGFVAKALPAEAQFSTAFSAAVGDFNNDGNEDLFLSQNTFAGRPNQPRQDGGRGLWLKGNGSGGFKSVSGKVSGIKVYGAQRGAALGDFNLDGKIDLAVTQNNGATKLFMNESIDQGLRVQLIGSKSNKNAVGAGLRLIYSDGRKGPLREIQAGSGYLSQHSFVQVMGVNKQPVGLEIKWPDGSIQTVDISEGKSEYVIKH